MATSYIRPICPNELYHYGIKGQKWGVRRYQNSDGSLTAAGKKRYISPASINRANNSIETIDRVRLGLTSERIIPANTKMYRVSVNKNETPESGRSTYVTYVQSDRNLYRAGWVRQLRQSPKAYETTYKLNQSIRIPSREDVEHEIHDILKDPKIRQEAFEKAIDFKFPKGSYKRAYNILHVLDKDKFESREDLIASEKEWNIKKVNNLLSRYENMTPSEAAYITQTSFGFSPTVKNELIDRLSAKGYNAIVDEASVGGRYSYSKEGVDPLIIFDSSVLKPVSKSELTADNEGKYQDEYEKWYSKNRANKNAW